MVSDIPPVIGAQAVSVAVRWASSMEVPAARAQLVRPLKVIQTSQLNSWRFIVEYTTSPRIERRNATATRVVFDTVKNPYYIGRTL